MDVTRTLLSHKLDRTSPVHHLAGERAGLRRSFSLPVGVLVPVRATRERLEVSGVGVTEKHRYRSASAYSR